MKVIAYFHFYLPYLLPRDADWKGKSLRLNSSEHEIVISARGSDEPVILENDKFILSMRVQLKSVADEHSVKAKTAEDECCDRLQVAVVGEVADEEQTWSRDVLSRYMSVAIAGANIFIDHCRVLSGQSAMAKLKRSVVSSEVSDPQFPYSVWWRNVETQKWLHGTGSGGGVSALLHAAVSWEKIDKQVGESIQPELPKGLLLDARQRFHDEDFREAVIAMAMACEVASNLYVERAGKADDPAVRKLLENKQISFAERRFHLLPKALSSRSLKEENASVFDRLERLYRVRNKVVHEGVLEEEGKITDWRSEIQVVSEFLGAAEAAARWLAELRRPPSA